VTGKIDRRALLGKKALVVGIAHEHSIAYGCAAAFHELGADVAITYLNERPKPYVEPLVRKLSAPLFLPLDVTKTGELETVFEAIEKNFGRLDILVHSIARAPKEEPAGWPHRLLRRRLRQSHDRLLSLFIRMAKLAAPLMVDGGSMFAMSYSARTARSRTTT
jgi:enoyl-[acyl-carrier protein] reductase I